MKKLYEGASVVSVIIFMMIVVGGFFFGITTHKDDSRRSKKIEKNAEKERAEKNKRYEEQMTKKIEEVEPIPIIFDPLWNYYDPDTDSYYPIPGRQRNAIRKNSSSEEESGF